LNGAKGEGAEGARAKKANQTIGKKMKALVEGYQSLPTPAVDRSTKDEVR